MSALPRMLWEGKLDDQGGQCQTGKVRRRGSEPPVVCVHGGLGCDVDHVSAMRQHIRELAGELKRTRRVPTAG